MQVTREDLNACTVKLDVACSPEDVKEGFARAVRAFGKRMRVPGFRPGTAPRHLIEPLIDDESLKGQAADEIVRLSIKKVLDQESLEPNGTPTVNVTKIEKDPAVCEFWMKVPLKPIVELSEYRGVEVESPSIEVTDEELEYHLNEMRQAQGKRAVVTDRPAQEGDNAVVNIRIDGEEGDGQKFMLTIGQTFKELDEVLTGMRPEEMKSAELEFPKEFINKTLAGKKAKCLVALSSLNAVRLPELDDTFAQTAKGDLAGFKSQSLDEMKKKLREAIARAKEQARDEYLTDQILAEVLNASKVEVPDTMWEGVAEQRLRELANDLAARGKTPQQYAEESGMTIEEMVENWKDEAKRQVRRALVVQQIFEAEKMRLTNQDLNVELMTMSEEMGIPAPDLVKTLQKNKALQELHFRGIFRKVSTFLRDEAKIKQLEPAKA